jgi:hypothetical protein
MVERMTRSQWADDADPGPELLAAYADGELDGSPALCRRLEGWLAAHPEAAAEVAAQRRLRHLWDAAAPPEPGEDAWEAARAAVAEHLSRAAAAARARAAVRRWLFVAGGGLAASVAVVWLTLALLSREGPPQTAQQHRPPAPMTLQPLPVATEDEIEILSVEGDDTGTLVVGDEPVRQSMVLAESGEVAVINMVPDVQLDARGSPMFLARDGDAP